MWPDEDDDDDDEDEEEEETTEKGPTFSVYSHTPDDLLLDPYGQMVFETTDTSGKEPDKGQGLGKEKEKVGMDRWMDDCVCMFV